MKYENLDKYLEKKGKKPKDKTKQTIKDFNKMLRADKDKLLLQMLKDFGYIE